MPKNSSVKLPDATANRRPWGRPARPCPRALVSALFTVLLLLFAAPRPLVSACPSGSFSLYMPTPKGGQTDLLYALLPGPWQEHMQTPLEIHHIPGRGGSYAISRLLDEKSDGCSLAAVVLPSFYLLSESPQSMYKAAELDIAAVLATAPNALWVAEGSPLHSLADLVRYARAENAKPGGFFAVSGTGSYTDQHLATLLFDRAAGIQSLYLPALGSAEAAELVKNGQALACWAYALNAASMPGMRPLGVAGERRSPVLPDVPTFRELQVDMVSESHFALALNAGVPNDVRLQLRHSLSTLAAAQSLPDRMTALGFIPLALEARDVEDFLAGQREALLRNLVDYELVPRHAQR